MTHPWNGPRHNSWASNTVLSGIALVVVFIATIVIDTLNGPEAPPTYLTGLLGVAAGSFFGAVGSDKGKREADIANAAESSKTRAAEASETALRAELKADILAEIAAKEHPEVADQIPPPLIPKSLRGEPPIEQEQVEGGGTS